LAPSGHRPHSRCAALLAAGTEWGWTANGSMAEPGAAHSLAPLLPPDQWEQSHPPQQAEGAACRRPSRAVPRPFLSWKFWVYLYYLFNPQNHAFCIIFNKITVIHYSFPHLLLYLFP